MDSPLAVKILLDGHGGGDAAARVVDDLRQHGCQLCVGAVAGDTPALVTHNPLPLPAIALRVVGPTLLAAAAMLLQPNTGPPRRPYCQTKSPPPARPYEPAD